MPPTDAPKICVDRVLSGAALLEARLLAMKERPENPPFINTPLRGSARSTGEGDQPSASLRSFVPSTLEMALETRTLWKPGRTLHVRFLDGDPGVQARVEAVAHQWEQHANLKLVFDDSPTAEIRISFVNDPGSWSYLGIDALTIPPDRPTMNYGWLRPNSTDAEVQRVVLHEFGHALGCIHEHQNPAADIPWNRERVYQYYAGAPNFWSRAQTEANLFAKYSIDISQFSQFDPKSIMLYPIPRTHTDGVFEVGMNMVLSDMDKTFVGQVYPQQATPITALTINALPLQAEIGAHGEEDLFTFVVAQPGSYILESFGRTDVWMGLFGPDDRTRQIAQDDDSGQSLNARITQPLGPGEYFVRIRHFRPRGSGKYSLSVRKV